MSKHEELIKSLRSKGNSGWPAGSQVPLHEAAADALEAQAREIEGLRKDAEALRLVVDHGITLTRIGRHIVARRADSREAWSRAIHGDDVRSAALAAIDAAKGASHG